ncbi:DNA-binding protein [Piscirickettsia salmonis]|uniref:Lon protease n=2 Tax=Piscirickettsia salmonis TaxID=1238 RepID=A0A9Q6LIC6_PISSA|nr:endopeptidase La [Piscirickettsia salmonis]WGZ70549.1 endopeptidase La [Piscirickettsia salmonis EM-90]ALA24310.1 DNA-binding protein [Piscirickettsia salmonis]APS44688.1 DNA-binding protein [Piscirickettsia salmonis]APS48048.1 DNA-binding protein [Piscirickettsia salmonis]APS52005.1 DNA-binding protein [Piscirickettsia salmonis]
MPEEKDEMVTELKSTEALLTLPLLPLRDVVVYPHTVMPLFVGRTRSIKALEVAMAKDQKVFLVAQRDAKQDDPGQEGLFVIGTVATVLQLLKLPDGTLKVLVEGEYRAHLDEFIEVDEIHTAQVSLLEEEGVGERELEVLGRSLISQFEQYVKLNKKIPPEVLSSMAGTEDPSRLADSIAAHLSLKTEDRQKLLEQANLRERLEQLMALLEFEIDLLQVEKRIRGRVKRQMEKSQREYYLNEQMKAIQKELGDLEDGGNELDELEKRIKESGMTEEAHDKAMSELSKLKNMSPMSSEATVCRNYIDALISVPWKKRSKTRSDLSKAEDVLEADHYGLEEVKERILEYLAVQKRVKKLKGPVLCLVGPPGVGKTSLGQSIAKATNRKFLRMALGGVRDEAEIRGHRRTYIGSMPGKIIQKLSKAEVKNPLFLLDEIDKMAQDFRGDPASALLEVLDPEQNHTFNDHYLEVDYDLSDVMFIATANSLNIPGPLLDRMEVIRIPGYTEDEKLNIAKRYLLPKQIKANGLKKNELAVEDEALISIIRHYTREAGVRSLEREISKVCRKVVKQILLKREDKETLKLTAKELEDYLGVQRYRYGEAEEKDQVGLVTGLAWTEVGGELLTIEAATTKGKGKVQRTGKLGDVMQESIQAAVTVVRSRAEMLSIPEESFEKLDVHIHVPEGATPKDGPSAGIGMCTALVSVYTSIPVRSDVAMTGEITLRGEVLPIGGLKEKLLAAHRGGIRTVLIPEENRRELKEIPENILKDLDVQPVRWIEDVLKVALTESPGDLTRLIASSRARSTEGQPGVRKH